MIAVLVTLYFWRKNLKGIHETSDKALRIMQITTVMVVVLIVWCGVTIVLRRPSLPPAPLPQNLNFAPDALGWLKEDWVRGIGLLGIMIAFGHSVLAMSGEETLAQVNREIAYPKVKNLKRAALVILVYTLLFTSLVSFFGVMIIPDSVRPHFYGNMIGGLAMNVVGPQLLRLAFHIFVVVVGFLILSGAVNTAIIGSNGVLNRVSEDGVLSGWFRFPHARYGTSYRIINMIVILQLATIVASRGKIHLLERSSHSRLIGLSNACAGAAVKRSAAKMIDPLFWRMVDSQKPRREFFGRLRLISGRRYDEEDPIRSVRPLRSSRSTRPRPSWRIG